MSTNAAPHTGHVLHWARSYDVLVWVLTLGRERRFRERLVELARIGPGESALDVGCGTGALAIAAKRRSGSSGEVCGLDASEEMVRRARRKATRSSADVRFETASVEALPFPDAAFDTVMATLMLHHLTPEVRPAAVAEITRVLKPGGRFLAVDIGGKAKGRHHGLLHRFGSHADFDLDELAPVLAGAGLSIVDRGPVGSPRVIGISDLRYVLAATPSD